MARSSLFPPSVQPGKPILGSCPDGWTTLTFGDVLRVVERPVALDDDAEYQLVTAKRSRGGVVARSRLKGRDILTKTQFMIERGDFLMSNRQIIHGGCGLVPPALYGAIVSNEYSVLRPTPRLHIEYLAYLTHSIYFQQTCFHASVGVDVEKMIFDCERWLSFKLHLPPLPEQRRIAEILSSVDEAIAATRAVIEQTRKVKQAVLERLLTKGIGHTRFKQTEIGEIPEGWSISKIGDLGEVMGGRQRSPAFTAGVERPYLRVANVFDNAIDTSDLLSMKFTDSEFRRYRLEPGDILLNEGQSIHLVGRNAKYEGIPEDCCFQNTLVRFRAAPFLDREFAFALMQHLYIRGRFSEIATQTTSVAHLGASRFASLVVPVPPIVEQHTIADFHNALLTAEAGHQAHFSRLLRTQSALMSDLLTGRKRVSDPLTLAAE